MVCPTPIRVGVPTAPKDTHVELAINATITAARAGKPNERSRGAARAAGVPKPADPSIKLPKNHAMMIACILRSAEMAVNPTLMAARAPLSLRVNSKARAPNTISRICMAIPTPFTLAARIQFMGVFQTKTASKDAAIKATGMALVAPQRKPTMRIKITAIGTKASRARTPMDMFL